MDRRTALKWILSAFGGLVALKVVEAAIVRPERSWIEEPRCEVLVLTFRNAIGASGVFRYVVVDEMMSHVGFARPPSASSIRESLEQIFGVGNIQVVHVVIASVNPDLTTHEYRITFVGKLANQRIGGFLTFHSSYLVTSTLADCNASSITLSTVTQGSCGIGQYDTYPLRIVS